MRQDAGECEVRPAQDTKHSKAETVGLGRYKLLISQKGPGVIIHPEALISLSRWAPGEEK